MTRYIVLLLITGIILSCSKDESHTIGQEYVEVNTNMRFIDTFSIPGYTVQLDSVITSGFQKALVGGYEHDQLGAIVARSYFQIGLPSDKSLPSSAEFDSIALILHLDGYSAGDTLQPYTIQAHTLREYLIAPEEENMYNTSTFAYDSVPLGSSTFYPYPNLKDTFQILLNKAFGQELFNMVMDNDEQISDENTFLNYLKGLVLTGDENKAVLRYMAVDTALFMRIFYHYTDLQTRHAVLDFPIGETSLQFNQFVRSGSVFEDRPQTNPMPASETGNITYIQGGAATVSRLEFPTVNRLPEYHQHMQLLKAELIIEPVKNTYTQSSLPNDIVLYETDEINRFGNYIADGDGNIQTGILTVDDLYHEETSYTFDVSAFINQAMFDPSDEPPALLVTLPGEKLGISLEDLTIGSYQHPENTIKLKVYYLDYE